MKMVYGGYMLFRKNLNKLLLFVLFPLVYGSLISFYDGPYKSKVVELETGKPIKGLL